jgi:hypothetical protein
MRLPSRLGATLPPALLLALVACGGGGSSSTSGVGAAAEEPIGWYESGDGREHTRKSAKAGAALLNMGTPVKRFQRKKHYR